MCSQVSENFYNSYIINVKRRYFPKPCTEYTGPFVLDKKATVKDITCETLSGKIGFVSIRRFDLPSACYAIVILRLTRLLSCSMVRRCHR